MLSSRTRLPARTFFRVLFATWITVAAAGCASLPLNTQQVPSQALASQDGTALGQLVAQRRNADQARADSGFALLGNADAAFQARVALVDAAQKTLDLQYYAIHADSTTEVLLEHMRQAARRGVRIRILLDDFNTVGDDAQVLRIAFEPNVQIRLFNPLPGSRKTLIGHIVASLHDFDRIERRMHNKLFIADNAFGIAGGRNLGDEYFGGNGKSTFVDLDVLAAGRIVRDMSASFDRYWNDQLAYPMQTLVTAQELDKLRQPPAPAQQGQGIPPEVAKAALPPPVMPAGSVLPTVSRPAAVTEMPQRFDLRNVKLTWAPSVLLADQPTKVDPDPLEAGSSQTVVDGLIHLLAGAQKEVVIVSPYFVPGPQLMTTFRDLTARGVHVTVLTNSLASNDAIAAHAGYVRYRRELVAMGIDLHEMRADLDGAPRALGSGFRSGAGSGTGSGGTSHPAAGAGLGSAGGGSKSGTSRASLHSKAVVIDGHLTVIGSMNLDLRSRHLNSEVGLLVRSATFAQDARQRILGMVNAGSYRVELHDGTLYWKAPPGADFPDATHEPEADLKLRLEADAIRPFAPEQML